MFSGKQQLNRYVFIQRSADEIALNHITIMGLKVVSLVFMLNALRNDAVPQTMSNRNNVTRDRSLRVVFKKFINEILIDFQGVDV